MKKYIYSIAMAMCCLTVLSVSSCSDDDFANKPQTIDLDAIKLTPIHGGCEVAWVPDPEDHNFVFLHVEFTDHDNKPRSYNVSRYGSELVTPFEKDKDGNPILNEKGEAVKTVIKDLVNQEYTLNFYGYNNENNRIGLGSRTITPLDYKQCDPDSIFAVSLSAKGGGIVRAEWKEPKYKTSTSTEKIFFRFNFGGGVIETQTADLGVRHADFIMENPGDCTVEYGTVSYAGKEWVKSYATPLSIVKFYTQELWTAEDKAGWTATCDSEYSAGGEGIINLIDGNIETHWSCDWETPNFLDKYTIDITLPEKQDIVGVILQQRQTKNNSWWRLAKHFSIEIKEEGSSDYSVVIEEGTLSDLGSAPGPDGPVGTAYLDKQYFGFKRVYVAKDIRLKVWEPLNREQLESPSSEKNLCMGEFGISIKDPNKSDE